ncbi:MAG: hypothetical protein MZV70_66605 [Desulfobacterales bacterium]|nr:hypothetical protein [Desulfobacterales bacterium]
MLSVRGRLRRHARALRRRSRLLRPLPRGVLSAVSPSPGPRDGGVLVLAATAVGPAGHRSWPVCFYRRGRRARRPAGLAFPGIYRLPRRQVLRRRGLRRRRRPAAGQGAGTVYGALRPRRSSTALVNGVRGAACALGRPRPASPPDRARPRLRPGLPRSGRSLFLAVPAGMEACRCAPPPCHRHLPAARPGRARPGLRPARIGQSRPRRLALAASLLTFALSPASCWLGFDGDRPDLRVRRAGSLAPALRHRLPRRRRRHQRCSLVLLDRLPDAAGPPLLLAARSTTGSRSSPSSCCSSRPA